MNQPNPYAAPSSVIEDDAGFDQDPFGANTLATRGSRLAAVMIDGGTGLLIALPVLAGFLLSNGGRNDAPLMVGGGIAVLCGLGLGIYNLLRLHENGQTIGKQLMEIKIVRSDRNTRASLPRIIFLRGMVIGLAAQIPFIGFFISLADPLFIFGEDQRCIHDYIADTAVIVDNGNLGEFEADSSSGPVYGSNDFGSSGGGGPTGGSGFGSTGTDGNSSGGGKFGPGGGSGGPASNDDVSW